MATVELVNGGDQGVTESVALLEKYMAHGEPHGPRCWPVVAVASSAFSLCHPPPKCCQLPVGGRQRLWLQVMPFGDAMGPQLRRGSVQWAGVLQPLAPGSEAGRYMIWLQAMTLGALM